MDFWLLDVKSTVIVNGKDIAFDYINTYFDLNEAIKEAKLLSMDEDILNVSVHHWILKEDGSQEHAEVGDGTDIPYMFTNRKHREFIKNFGRKEYERNNSNISAFRRARAKTLQNNRRV